MHGQLRFVDDFAVVQFMLVLDFHIGIGSNVFNFMTVLATRCIWAGEACN